MQLTIFAKLFAHPPQISWSETLQRTLTVIAIGMIIGTIMFGVFFPIGTTNIKVFYLLFCFVLLFGQELTKGKRTIKLAWLVLLLASLASLAYIWVNQVALEERVGFPIWSDTIIGVIVIVAVFIGSYRAWGPIVPVIAAFGIAYAFFGMHLPGEIAAPRVRTEYIIAYLSTNLTGTFSFLLQISALYILPFIIFGQLLKAAGVPLLISEGGKLLSKRIVSAPALTAVAGSSVIGMATGSPAANILITGTFTIPWMKKAGYKPSLAAAIEAVASTGGQIMPPIMGAVAFIMTFYLEVAYIEVAIAAALPALLFYGAILFSTYFASKRFALLRISEEVTATKGTILRKVFIFVCALGITTFFLVERYSVGYAGTFGIATLLILSLIENLMTGNLRFIWREWIKSCSTGALISAQIGIVLALLGMFTEVINNTGLGVKLTSAFVTIGGGNVWLIAILVSIVIIILGCALPTAPAYIIGILVVAPALQKLGITGFQLHFFILYFAVIALITPPVGIASMIAAKVANSNYLQTAFDGVKLVAVVWLLPFLFLTNPWLLLLEGEGALTILVGFAGVLAGIVFLESGLWGYFLTPLKKWERVLGGIVGIGLLGLILTHLFELIFLVGIFLLMVVFIGNQIRALYYRRKGI